MISTKATHKVRFIIVGRRRKGVSLVRMVTACPTPVRREPVVGGGRFHGGMGVRDLQALHAL